MIPLRFTKWLDLGPQTSDSRDGELLEEEVEEVAGELSVDLSLTDDVEGGRIGR